jgi:hypothetical protein
VTDSAADISVESPPAEAAPAAPEPTCPRCKWRLIDPEEMGYCPSCGYCKYVEMHRRWTRGDLTPKRPTRWLGLRAAVDAVAATPGWLAILLGGCFAILLHVKATDQLLSPHSEERALIGLTLILAGLLALGLSHLLALLKVAPSQINADLWDLLSPGLVWGSAFRRLPESRWPIWLAAWSITLVLAAWVFVGGFGYWFPDDAATLSSAPVPAKLSSR